MKLSERLELAAKIHSEIGGQSAMADTIREAAELARRVEGAAAAKVRGKVGDVCMVPVSHDYCGQRVRLVPEDGLGGVDG